METIADKEMEALLFVMDDTAVMMEALGSIHGMIPVVLSLERLRPQIEARRMPEIEDDVDRAIIRFVIERSDWLDSYRASERAKPHDVEEAMETMRQLARRFEPLGVEVDCIAS